MSVRGFISSCKGNAGVVEDDKLMEEFGKLLGADETMEIGFSVHRDTFIFTGHRLILVDVQGLGRKIEYLSMPYTKITKFSIETAGHLDSSAELKIWTPADDKPLHKKFDKTVDIYAVQGVLAKFVLQ
jgi:hypothetical protein